MLIQLFQGERRLVAEIEWFVDDFKRLLVKDVEGTEVYNQICMDFEGAAEKLNVFASVYFEDTFYVVQSVSTGQVYVSTDTGEILYQNIPLGTALERASIMNTWLLEDIR